MRSVWCLKLIFLSIIVALGGAAAFATIAPDTTRSILFRQIDWQALSPEEQKILKPLAGKWAGMRYEERERWRMLAGHYEQMSPTEQKRIQKRMQRWAEASSKQRRIARNAYQKFKGKHPAEKEQTIAAWHNYAAAQGMLDDPDEKAAPAQPEPDTKTLAASNVAEDKPTSPANP